MGTASAAKKVIDSKELLMVALSKFFSAPAAMSKVLPILQGNSIISLRLLDWFVTNYAKKNSTVIVKQTPEGTSHFNVYLSYRSQLKAYKKQLFDPFRRRDRITFYYEKENAIVTTIGQLNFFRWVIVNDILDYIHQHYKVIEEDMISVQKSGSSSAATPSVTAKRNELSKSFVKNMNMYEGSRVISFA